MSTYRLALSSPRSYNCRGTRYRHQSQLQSWLKISSNIGRDKSFVDDLNKERGIVRMRVAFVPRSAEIQPLFWRFVTFTHNTTNKQTNLLQPPYNFLTLIFN